MFGRSLFQKMEEDPFFSDHRDHMARMEGMFRDPFRSFGMLEDGHGRERERGRERGGEQGREVAPFGEFGFGNMFGSMSRMMQDMDKTFAQASQRSGENGAMYQQSSFMSYSKSGEGPPKVFEASSATRSGPGGVRETRKTVRDSERELEKMAVGHHIYDRGHEIEKHKNTRTGQYEERQNYHNLEERDAEGFNTEWQQKARTSFKGLDHHDRPVRGGRHDRREVRDRHSRPQREQLALPDPRDSRSPAGSEGRRSEHWGKSGEGWRRDRS